jgi:hypothetical protein
MQCQLNHVYIAPTQAQPVLESQAIESTANRAMLQGLLPLYIELGKKNTSTPQYHGLPWRAEVDFLNNDAQSSHIADSLIAINQTGVYIMWFVTCDAELAEVQPLLHLPMHKLIPSGTVARAICTLNTRSKSYYCSVFKVFVDWIGIGRVIFGSPGTSSMYCFKKNGIYAALF